MSDKRFEKCAKRFGKCGKRFGKCGKRLVARSTPRVVGQCIQTSDFPPTSGQNLSKNVADDLSTLLLPGRYACSFQLLSLYFTPYLIWPTQIGCVDWAITINVWTDKVGNRLLGL
ncbi:hypothetical protein AVEN_224361-1 [Araneus ventricosus]|uniref:Uncharacterized protein n=1 Tax=Araneus ventricosus TaxID=182803 RepID=A0A4Y2UFS4_ARAVE|nr:hypothetical protein AVEN_35776-1 [Araneus ventricosus]GBO11403.1 hypothetical protein AVEN_224361-1 [Araneus ventricosus]